MILALYISCILSVPDTSFVRVPAGEYWVGQKGHAVNPARKVRLSTYEIGVTEVTNRQFAAFIKATGYQTDAERRHDALVFEPGLREFRWKEDSTATWRYPNGIRNGGIEQKMDHPVTTISYRDIHAYCEWAGVRLPSFDEWEVASRAGARTTFFWGEDAKRIGTYANIWHGRDHLQSDTSDGFMYTAPVGSFPPNPWGLYDVYGNVFEFCEGHLGKADVAHARGGSWWCSAHACNFFNSVDIGRVSVYASFSNLGCRVVKK
ncbi:formylglycine-generating enzyme family protein [Chitinophaga horti]|uniref:Formylglycine-generating enzyme family protein n=1 Tax=Chitinophaga horti TaxID=2920382 RepID=A0ABY6J7C7_9BACT|nr:formylglycine-generating enzyme family protein [Chitinophaga horti]UYQ94196.1 formylglycine-generating enzyme family protein [Chitinophaga horti]